MAKKKFLRLKVWDIVVYIVSGLTPHKIRVFYKVMQQNKHKYS